MILKQLEKTTNRGLAVRWTTVFLTAILVAKIQRHICKLLKIKSHQKTQIPSKNTYQPRILTLNTPQTVFIK